MMWHDTTNHFSQSRAKPPIWTQWTIGIQRGCAQIPEDSIEGECNFEDILNGTTKAEVCYCRGNSCNSGDIFTTTKIPTKDPSTFPPSLWNS